MAMSHFNVEDIDNTQSMSSTPPFKEDVEDAILVTAHEVLCGYIRVVPLQEYEEFVKLESSKGCSSVEMVKENRVNGAELCPNENNVKEADNISNEACFDESLLEVRMKEEEITIEETCILVDENQCEEESDDGFPTEVDNHKNEAQAIEEVEKGRFSCNMCRKSFKTQYDLNKHVLIHSEGNHLCEVCGISFKTISGLSKHFPVHKESEKSSADTKIDKINYVPEIREEPLESQTDSVKVVSAQFGNKTLNVEERLTEISYVCKICRRSYSSSGGLAKHVLTHSEKKMPESEKQEDEMIHNVNNMPGTKKEDRKRSVCNVKRKSFETTDDSSKDFLIHTRNRPSYTETEIRSTRNVRTIERNSCETSNNRVTRSVMYSENKIVSSEKDMNKNRNVDKLYGKSFETPKVPCKHSLMQAGTELSNAKEVKERNTKSGMAGKKEIERNYTESEPQNAEEKIRKRRGVYKVCNSEERSLMHMEGGTVNAEVEVGKRSRQCSICRKSFNNSNSLIKHFLTHTENETLENVKNEGNQIYCIENEVPEAEKKASEACVDHKLNTEPYVRLWDFAKQSLVHTEPVTPSVNNEFNKSNCVLTPSRSHRYSCEHCNKSFASFFLFKRHSCIHTGMRPYTCDKCDKSFKERSRLKRKTFEHKTNTKPYIRVRDFAKQLFMHTEHVTQNTDKEFDKSNCSFTQSRSLKYSCEYCNKRFPTPFRLNNHIRVHTGERPYKCEKCGMSFKEKTHLKRHISLYGDKCHFICKVCNKEFASELNLKAHAAIHKQLKDGSFVCDTCGKSFVDMSFFRLHVLKHGGAERHACTVCNRRFVTLDELNMHKAFHYAERRYKCKFCPKKFVNNFTLARHERTHTDERRHKCMKCKMSFKKSQHLKDHAFLHTRGRLFECDECKKKFKQPTALHRHLRIHLRSKEWAPKYGFKGFNLNPEIVTSQK